MCICKRKISLFIIQVVLRLKDFFLAFVGVLDPEELCRVNKGFKKSDIQLIPEVEENIWSPAESNSLINRDFSSLASLEIDLFDDSKSSIHETSKATDVRTSSCKFGEENGLQNTHCEYIAEKLKVLAGSFTFVVGLNDKLWC